MISNDSDLTFPVEQPEAAVTVGVINLVPNYLVGDRSGNLAEGAPAGRMRGMASSSSPIAHGFAEAVRWPAPADYATGDGGASEGRPTLAS